MYSGLTDAYNMPRGLSEANLVLKIYQADPQVIKASTMIPNKTIDKIATRLVSTKREIKINNYNDVN